MLTKKLQGQRSEGYVCSTAWQAIDSWLQQYKTVVVSTESAVRRWLYSSDDKCRNQIVVDIVVGCKKQGEKRGRPLGKRFFDATNEGERRPVLLVYMTVVRVYERYLKPRQVDCAQGEPRGSWSPYDWMRARFLRRT